MACTHPDNPCSTRTAAWGAWVEACTRRAGTMTLTRPAVQRGCIEGKTAVHVHAAAPAQCACARAPHLLDAVAIEGKTAVHVHAAAPAQCACARAPHLLDAVAMVHIPVQHEHALHALVRQRHARRDRAVVEEAKALGARALGVVARRAHHSQRRLHMALQHCFHGLRRGGGRRGGSGEGQGQGQEQGQGQGRRFRRGEWAWAGRGARFLGASVCS